MSYYPTPQHYGNGLGQQPTAAAGQYPPAQQSMYGQPQYGQPQYGQPQYGQPQYGQPQYGQPQCPLGAPPLMPHAQFPPSTHDPQRSPSATMPHCPQHHPLTAAPLHVTWHCDGCNSDCAQGTVAFQCRTCNYDLCDRCAMHTGGGAVPSASGSSVVATPASALTCPGGHGLTTGALHVVWNCDACHMQQRDVAPHPQCRLCDYDICNQCAAAKQQGRPQPPSGAAAVPTSYGLTACSQGGPTCPNGHGLIAASIPSVWNCDLCCASFPMQSQSHGCRACNYDLCPQCAQRAAPSQAPLSAHPQQYATSAAQPLSMATSSNRMKCLFVGVNYEHSAEALSGCVNDVRVVQALLQSVGYDISHSRTLVDAPASGQTGIINVFGRPNKRDIYDGLDWLVANAQPGDTLFFHFSGHGSQAADQDGDEDDGFDETIVPLDFRTAGQIRDDDLFERLVRRVPRGCRLTCIADCCHSGSILDLPYIWLPPSSSSAQQSRRRRDMGATRDRGFKLDGGIAKTCEGDVLLVSGCKDEQTSADVGNAGNFLATTGRTQSHHAPGGAGSSSGVFTAASSSRSGGGACTLSLVDALRGGRYKQRSFMQVLEDMLTCLSTKRLGQVPQFSASKPFEFSHPFSFSGPLPPPA